MRSGERRRRRRRGPHHIDAFGQDRLQRPGQRGKAVEWRQPAAEDRGMPGLAPQQRDVAPEFGGELHHGHTVRDVVDAAGQDADVRSLRLEGELAQDRFRRRAIAAVRAPGDVAREALVRQPRIGRGKRMTLLVPPAAPTMIESPTPTTLSGRPRPRPPGGAVTSRCRSPRHDCSSHPRSCRCRGRRGSR